MLMTYYGSEGGTLRFRTELVSGFAATVPIAVVENSFSPSPLK